MYFNSIRSSLFLFSCWVLFWNIILKGGGVMTFNIWSMSLVGIGIGRKMLKKQIFLKNIQKIFKIIFRIEILLHLGVPDKQILLNFGVPNNQILLLFRVPDNQILLHCGVPDNCSSGQGMARRIYSLTSCRGHRNGVRFGGRGHRNRVKFSCWGH